MVGHWHVRAVSHSPYPEPQMEPQSDAVEIYAVAYTANHLGKLCLDLHDWFYDQRHYSLAPRIVVSAHTCEAILCQKSSHALGLLGICPDVSPSGFSLEYDYQNDKSAASAVNTGLCLVFPLMIASYCAYAFVKRDIGDYMLLKSQFVFFNFEEPLILFLLDYLFIMGTFVWVGHYLRIALQRISTRTK